MLGAEETDRGCDPASEVNDVLMRRCMCKTINVTVDSFEDALEVLQSHAGFWFTHAACHFAIHLPPPPAHS
jgi:hypothetical protein